MRQVIVLSLLCAGLAVATLQTGPSTEEREAQVAAVTRIIAQGTSTDGAPTVYAEQPNLRQAVTPSPALPTFDAPAAPMTSAGVTAPPPVAVSANDPSNWTTNVDETPALAPTKSVTVSSEQARRKLARALQTELKRVGCFEGRADGNWDGPSRRAMSEFVQRVNATLPVAEPDVILLTLVRGHRGEVCDLQCGAGEVARSGRCIARTVVAAATPDRAPEARADVLPGRMSVGGPIIADRETAAGWPPARSPGTGSIESLPWQDAEPDRAAKAPVAPAPRRLAAVPEDIASPHLANDTQQSAAVTATPETEALLPPPRRAAKPARVRPSAGDRPRVASRPPPRQAKRNYASRSIQQLFLHPLGRM